MHRKIKDFLFNSGYFTLILLSFFAIMGNSFNLPLFSGIDFIFGSIAVMLGALFYGVVPALVIAIIGSFYTIFLWSHPYALIIFTSEALFVSYFLRRGYNNVVITDLIVNGSLKVKRWAV